MATRVEEPVSIAKYDEKKPVDRSMLGGGSGTGPLSKVDERLKKALEARHEEYQRYVKTWERCLDCYTGDIETMRDYLHQHTREHAKDFNERQKRSFYVNYVEPIVDLYVSYIFRRGAVRNPLGDLRLPIPIERLLPQSQAPPQQSQGEEEPQGGAPAPPGPAAQGRVPPGKPTAPPPEHPDTVPADPEAEQEAAYDQVNEAQIAYWLSQGGPRQLAIFQELYKDADLRGTTFDRFMQKAATYAQICGHAGVLIDAPRIEKQPRTEAERKQMKLRPYLVMYEAKDIVDWDLDDKGKFKWVRLKEDGTTDRSDPFTNPDDIKKQTRYITWTKDSWFVHVIDEQDNLIESTSGGHRLGKVPFVALYNKKKASCQLVGDSAVDDISIINIAVFNWLSMLDEEVYQKTLNILAIKAEGGEGEGPESIVLSSKNVIEYPEEAPKFISPSSDPGKFVLELVQKMIEEMYRIAKLGGGGEGLEIHKAKSGIAHAFEFNETNQALSDKADQLEQAELEIHAIYAEWYRMDYKGTVTYPDEFGVEDLNDEFEFLTKSRSAITSHTALREMEKRVVKKLLSRTVDKQTMQRIEFEIDSNTKDDYKIPGEFVVPGAAPKPSSSPGRGAQLQTEQRKERDKEV